MDTLKFERKLFTVPLLASKVVFFILPRAQKGAVDTLKFVRKSFTVPLLANKVVSFILPRAQKGAVDDLIQTMFCNLHLF